ncbi:germination lipoprotein GerS-related protein [Hathewaya massiliensis]|uniref:germination lipoprotein GerS-related protein n=1 Tax=Hathewaya massiliensis TaxID=1964382 RepID=UPI001157627F|nr:germination lipoprotein GerS-related protein [Hathewaya massiliensis]
MNDNLKKNIIGKHYFKFIVIVLLSVWIFTLFKLFYKTEDNTSKTLEALKSIESYSTNISITCKNNKQELVYTGKQKYLKNKGSLIELGKNTYLYKDGKRYVKNNDTGKVIEEKAEKEDVFRLSFIEEYLNYLYTEQNLKNIKTKSEGKDEETLCFQLLGNNENLRSAKLIISNIEGLPKELIILNKKNEVTVKIKYENFLKNEKVNEAELKF